MNCKNFEATISDLARASVMDAAQRQSAISHMDECKTCASRFEAERALTSSLRAFAASDETLRAPARVEANLLAKFRERAKPAQDNNVVVQMPLKSSRWSRILPQAVAAAVLLMFAIGGAITLRVKQAQAPAQSQPKAVASNNKSAAAAPQPTNVVAPPDVENNSPENDMTATASTDNQEGKNSSIKYRGREAALLRGELSVPKSRINRAVKENASSEIATDFMPVSYGDNLNEIDNGRIVRVEMPRSALAQFGLPVNMERANERIKADVLIGDDGMARAIRFVR